MNPIELVRDAINVAKELNNLDLRKKLVELEGQVLDMQTDLRRKDTRIAELELAFDFKGKAVFKNNTYWIEGDSHPYCPTCFDRDRKLVHMVTFGLGMTIYLCGSCGTKANTR